MATLRAREVRWAGWVWPAACPSLPGLPLHCEAAGKPPSPRACSSTPVSVSAARTQVRALAAGGTHGNCPRARTQRDSVRLLGHHRTCQGPPGHSGVRACSCPGSAGHGDQGQRPGAGPGWQTAGEGRLPGKGDTRALRPCWRQQAGRGRGPTRARGLGLVLDLRNLRPVVQVGRGTGCWRQRRRH